MIRFLPTTAASLRCENCGSVDIGWDAITDQRGDVTTVLEPYTCLKCNAYKPVLLKDGVPEWTGFKIGSKTFSKKSQTGARAVSRGESARQICPRCNGNGFSVGPSSIWAAFSRLVTQCSKCDSEGEIMTAV
jgi:hypothetical protein